MATKRKLSDSQDIPRPSGKRSCTISKHNGHSANNERQSKKCSDNWGIIESISLRNFMCHSRLTMHFTSSINFIVGHNGSGKSAVLTGIIVGLGGKAASTNRGTSLKTLIKTGFNTAVVELTLRNNGDDPVKPEVFGSKIIIERKITSDGTSSYKIKNDSGKVVSTRKEDLVGILDEIDLHVDNPLTCLNQEMSKNFLHSKSENDKYKFFLKATQLEQMHRDYRYIQEQKLEIDKTISYKQKVIPELEKEVLEKEQRFRDLATLQELKSKVEDLKCELAWAQVAQLEHNLKPLKKELDRENLRTPKYDAALQNCLDKEKLAQAKFDELQKKVKQYQQEVKLLEPNKKQSKDAFDQLKIQCKSTENALNRAKKQLHDTQKDKSQMEAKIVELKHNAKTNIEDEKQKREQRLASLRDRANELQAKLKTTTHQADQFTQAALQAKEKLSSYRQESRDLEQERNKLNHKLNSLNSNAGRKNKLQLFGPKMPEFVKKIDEAYSKCKFKQKPRGPIGSCVTLKDQTKAVAVECAIKNLIHSFVVDNHHDEKVLEQLRNSIFSEYERSRIVIYTVKFSSQIYNVSHGKVNHPVYSSVLDVLNIEDPVVANCLIDMNHIESILVIPNTQDALKTMQEGNPPRNCSRAYTSIGDEILVDRFYSNQSEPVSRYLKGDVEGEISRHQRLLKQLSEQLQGLKTEVTKLSKEAARNETEHSRHERIKLGILEQLKNIRIQVRELEAIEDPQPFDVKDLEDEVLNYTQQIASLAAVVKDHTKEMESLSELKDQRKAACDEVYCKMKEIADNAEELTEKINQASRELEKAKADWVHFNEGKKKHLETLQKVQDQIEAKKKQIEAESKKAAIICKEKIVTRRTPNNLENEIKQINRRISQEESQHGQHELIVREYHEVREQFKCIRKHIRWSKNFIKEIDDYLEKRHNAYFRIRSLIALRCTMDFNSLLEQRGFTGKMQFDHEQRILLISVKPHDNASQSTDLRVLSGGERSFSTVCYILALWQAIESPLRCLDEFDVFMDMANRRVAMDMMVEMALMHHKKQFIFLTPHDISALPKSSRLHVWKMADPDRGQTHLPFERI